ncbi:transglutaminaseTgpA domain-containing protein [soil metagenome]
MYDISQFRPVLYLLLMLGISGFALAAQTPAMWVLASGAVLLNGWLVVTSRFRPLPRLLANVITISALAVAFAMLRRSGSPPILVIGQFLVILQVVKLYEQRGNRDFAQLLVLSLLLMVAAAISTASLGFGVMFVGYLFLSLYACLLFHLKVETDHAKAAIGVPQDKLNPMTLRQDQRYLPRSMRRLTMLVSVVSVAMAVLVFLFFPRNTGVGLLGPLQYRAVKALSGFSGEMKFQQVAQITQDTRQVAYVKVFDGERNVGGTQSLLLRGVTLDVYTGKESPPWQWQHSPGTVGIAIVNSLPNDAAQQISVANRMGTNVRRQEIILDPTGTETIFAMPGVTDFRISTRLSSEAKLTFQPRDQTMKIEPTQDVTLRYEVWSDGTLKRPDDDLDESDNPLLISSTQPASNDDATNDGKGPPRSVIDPQIEAYARRPDVSGSDEQGPLVARRPREKRVTALDEKIAQNIERHLKGDEFAYTLDLTDAARIGEGRDPMVAFLYDLKRGHCEYFAGAMTLMCQSLGLQARVVIGFRCDDFNNLTNSYMVRQNHAHAWVEVLNDKREWITFDPTSGRDLGSGNRNAGILAKLKHLFDYLEYTWANSVVAYDKDSRSSLIQNVEVNLGKSAQTGADAMNKAKSWFDVDRWFDESPGQQVIRAQFWQKLVAILIAVLVVALIGALVWFFLERWKMRRRARRIGLVALPPRAQLRLARQLGFYDEMIRALAKYGVKCAPNLTPGEFSRSIAFLPSELFDVVRRLTNIFYKIRYGQAELSSSQQRRLKTSIARIESAMQHLHSPAKTT